MQVPKQYVLTLVPLRNRNHLCVTSKSAPIPQLQAPATSCSPALDPSSPSARKSGPSPPDGLIHSTSSSAIPKPPLRLPRDPWLTGKTCFPTFFTIFLPHTQAHSPKTCRLRPSPIQHTPIPIRRQTSHINNNHRNLHKLTKTTSLMLRIHLTFTKDLNSSRSNNMHISNPKTPYTSPAHIIMFPQRRSTVWKCSSRI